MLTLLETLARWADGSPGAALPAALAWGVLSILLSPCHMAGIPLIVGYMSGHAEMTPRRAFRSASAFAFGVLVSIAVLGGLTAALGRIAGDLGGWTNYAVAVVFFVAGLHLLDVIPFQIAGTGQVRTRRRGPLAALALGLVFGVALGPCTFAFMAPVLAAAFRAAGHAPLYATALLVAYGAGHCGVIVAAGTFLDSVQRYLQWHQGSRGMSRVKAACGVLVLLGGLYLVYTAR